MAYPFTNGPCYNGGKDCCDRYPGCSAKCQRYKDWKADLEAAKANRHREREFEISRAQNPYWKQMYYLHITNPSSNR